MSKLKTFVPVDIKSVLNALPPRTHIESITLRMETSLAGGKPIPIGVEVVWDCDEIRTGRTYAVDFPLDKLGAYPINNDKVLLESAPKGVKKKIKA